MKNIYFDYAATTPVNKKVLQAMKPYFYDIYGNTSSIHSFGQKALAAVDQARDIIASFLNTNSANILFTSGATESNNMVIKNILNFPEKNELNIIISNIEHPSVMETAKYLITQGIEVRYLPVDNSGKVILNKLDDLIDANTILISVMYVNNETGVCQPIEEIGNYLTNLNKNRKRKILFHTDAVQAVSEFLVDVKKLQVDFMSLSAHKISGPKGVGCLYVKDINKINSLLTGGHQEKNKRAGTLNVPNIVGFGKAIELLQINFDKNLAKISKLYDYFIELLNKNHPNIRINGQGVKAKKIVNICIKNNSAEEMLIKLNQHGFAVSAGSACNSGAIGKSYVLKAMNFCDKDIKNSIRFSFGNETTKKQIKIILDFMSKIIR